MNNMRILFLGLIFSMLLAGCDESSEVIHDLSDENFTLVNQDSTAVNFPSDFENKYLIVGFIYTHCPDICNIITAKMLNISNELKDTTDVHFIAITFDPKRDTPNVLNDYMQKFKLDEDQFTMLTGDSTSINNVLNKMDIEAKVSFNITHANGQKSYLMNHTNRISVMDPQGRVRFEYPGSAVPIEHVTEDLNKIRKSWYEIF